MVGAFCRMVANALLHHRGLATIQWSGSSSAMLHCGCYWWAVKFGNCCEKPKDSVCLWLTVRLSVVSKDAALLPEVMIKVFLRYLTTPLGRRTGASSCLRWTAPEGVNVTVRSDRLQSADWLRKELVYLLLPNIITTLKPRVGITVSWGLSPVLP